MPEPHSTSNPHPNWSDRVRADVATWPPLTADQLALVTRVFIPAGGAR